MDHSLNIYQSSEHLLATVQSISLYISWRIWVLVFKFCSSYCTLNINSNTNSKDSLHYRVCLLTDTFQQCEEAYLISCNRICLYFGKFPALLLGKGILRILSSVRMTNPPKWQQILVKMCRKINICWDCKLMWSL